MHSTEVAFLLIAWRPPVQCSAFTNVYFDVAKIYQLRWLEKSGQTLENVDRTHLVLASGKLVTAKSAE